LKEKLLLKKFKVSLMVALMEEIQKMLILSSLILVVSQWLLKPVSQNGKMRYLNNG